MHNDNKINQPESSFKRSMWLVCWVTLMLPPLTGIFMLSFVGVFPFPEVLYPFTDYALIVVILSTIVAIKITQSFIKYVIDIRKSVKKIKAEHKHLKMIALYYFSILFLYFGLGLVSTLYSLSTLYNYNYPLSKYVISFFGVIPGGLITALPIFYYLSDSLGRYIAPTGIHISIAPIKLKLIVLGTFTPVLIDTLLIMYFYDRTGYLSYETIGIWFFLIVVAGIGTAMAWKSFKQSMSPFITALELEGATPSAVSIIPQSLDELGLLSQHWNSLLLRVNQYEEKLSGMNASLQSDIHQRSQELESERQLNIKILDNATALIIVLDNEGRILRFNPAGEKMTGFSFSELENKFIWDYLIPPEQLNDAKEVFRNLTVGGIDSQYENELMKKDGGRVLMTWNNSTVLDETGEVECVISIGIDISERQAVQKELEEAKDAANKANVAKSDFLSKMSHELRTPMNAILGFGQILDMGADNLDEIQKSNVKEILDAGSHLLSLINEILDLAKIESGEFEVSSESVSVDKVLSECISMTHGQIEMNQLALIDNVSGKEHHVMGDFFRMKQVLLNLLSNAAKYNILSGTITLDSKLINNHRLRLSVTSTGKGMSSDEISKLFTPFERLNAEEYIEGTGIGLTISKHLVELMGGIIGVESVKGGDTTFWVELNISDMN